jgi:ribosome-binding protein aMBF1 (putative translation factor)
MSYEHQDWTPVVVRKYNHAQVEKQTIPSSQAFKATMSHVSAKPAWKIEKQVDSDTGKPIKYVTKINAAAIVRARIIAKLTQKQLAQKLNIQEKDIKDIEQGTAVENNVILSKIRRFLNI